MAFGPSPTLNQAVMEAFSQGGDFSSYFGSALATAAVNLLDVGADAAAVPTAFVEARLLGQEGTGGAQQLNLGSSACSASLLAASGCCSLGDRQSTGPNTQQPITYIACS